MPPLRSTRERVIQTIWYEGLALVFVTPLFALATGSRSGESILALVSVSVVAMMWAAGFNTVFDRVEHRLTGRMACRRTYRARALHVASLEASSTIVTWPVIWITTDLGWLAALLADVGLTAVYVVYGYGFHLAFDRFRPVTSAVERERTPACTESPARRIDAEAPRRSGVGAAAA